MRSSKDAIKKHFDALEVPILQNISVSTSLQYEWVKKMKMTIWNACKIENLVNKNGIWGTESLKAAAAAEAKVLLLLTMLLVNGMHKVCSSSLVTDGP